MKKKGAALHPTRTSLPVATRQAVIQILNQTLADLLDLESQLRNAHWNVRGPHFQPLHALFEELADSVESHVDDLAERLTAFGGRARGSVREAALASRLPELPEVSEGFALVDALADRFARLAHQVRADVAATAELEDPGTSDLLTGLSQALDKGLWLLEAHTPVD